MPWSCDEHFAPQIEQCGLSTNGGLSQYDFILVYDHINQLRDDLLTVLRKLNLEKYYFQTGKERRDELFETRSRHFSGAKEKLSQYGAHSLLGLL